MVANPGLPQPFRMMPWHRAVGFPFPRAQFVRLPQPLRLDSGVQLPVTVCFEEWGNPQADDVVVIFHALTGDSHVARHGPGDPVGWWERVLDTRGPFDPARHRILCANTLGGCMGTTGPGTPDEHGTPWGSRFPPISIWDMVEAEFAWLDAIGVRRPVTLVGGSMGGMKVLAALARYPERVARAVVIGAPVAHSPWAIAFHTVGRDAIRRDPAFCGGDFYENGRFPETGLAVARMADMISYQSPESMARKFGRARQGERGQEFRVESYLRYQGRKLVARFDPNTYLALTRAMDAFDLLEADPVWANGAPPVLLMAIRSDVLYPLPEMEITCRTLQERGLAVELAVLEGPWGHDTFLVEQPRTASLIARFLNDHP